jgi:hypothetical protein
VAKPQAKTLQERMGFVDHDLKTPGHDAIMLWLDDSATADQLAQWLGCVSGWSAEELEQVSTMQEMFQRHMASYGAEVAYHLDSIQSSEAALQRYESELQQEADANHRPDLSRWIVNERQRLQKAQAEAAQWAEAAAEHASDTPPTIPVWPGLTITRKQWERPVMSREYTVGFVDLAVQYERPVLHVSAPASAHQRFIPRPTWRISWHPACAYFEVKTAIPSLGELLRQLNQYRQYLGRDYETSEILVVCPDARFAEKIREQGFGFVQSPPAQASINGQAAREPWLFGR